MSVSLTSLLTELSCSSRFFSSVSWWCAVNGKKVLRFLIPSISFFFVSFSLHYWSVRSLRRTRRRVPCLVLRSMCSSHSTFFSCSRVECVVAASSHLSCDLTLLCFCCIHFKSVCRPAVVIIKRLHVVFIILWMISTHSSYSHSVEPFTSYPVDAGFCRPERVRSSFLQVSWKWIIIERRRRKEDIIIIGKKKSNDNWRNLSRDSVKDTVKGI